MGFGPGSTLQLIDNVDASGAIAPRGDLYSGLTVGHILGPLGVLAVGTAAAAVALACEMLVGRKRRTRRPGRSKVSGGQHHLIAGQHHLKRSTRKRRTLTVHK